MGMSKSDQKPNTLESLEKAKNMGEANEKRRREMHNLSLEIEKYPRDLLQRFMLSSDKQQSQLHTTQNQQQQQEEEDTEEIELNLGLSLGGRFGVDKNAKKLIRSSSIAGMISIQQQDDDVTATTPGVSYPNLIRTSSLPTETEEEWRKRKELQTLRRMEAKRRRSEKQRNSISKAEKMELNLEENKDRLQFVGVKGQPSSQGSLESQGGSSSGMSVEMESRAVQGLSSCGEAKSPVSNQSLQDRSNQEAVGSSGAKTSENACRTSRLEVERKPDSAEKRVREIGMNSMEDMPCVFTKGDGPNGRRIEGILYRYGKGEEVRIMCVCHGSFLSPAEFVKHAGGGDVDHPLKHIVVNPSSTSFL